MGRWRIPPPLALILVYAGLILAGTLLLVLPISVSAPISLSDAAFTATSAVTVTGLGVVDTGAGFTLDRKSVV